MFKSLIFKSITLFSLIVLFSACSLSYQALTGHKYGSTTEYKNGQWVEKKPEPPKPPNPFELEIQKYLVNDILIGHACNNKYSFEIKIAGTEPAYEKMSFLLSATLIAKLQNNQQFKTRLRSNLLFKKQNFGALTLYAYTAPSRNRQPTMAEAKANLLRGLRIDLVRDVNGVGWEGTLEGENFPACLDLTLVSSRGRKTSVFPTPIYPYIDNNAMGFARSVWPKYGVFSTPITHVVQIYWTKKYVALYKDQSYILGKKYESLVKVNTSYNARALEAYHVAAERYNNYKAYGALYRMYSTFEKDAPKAKRWLDLWNEVHRPANEICTNPKVRKAFVKKWHRSDGEKIGKLFAAEFTGLNKQFKCIAVIERVVIQNPLYTQENFDEYARNENFKRRRNMYYESDGMELFGMYAGNLFKNYAEERARRPFTGDVDIYPAGGGKFVINDNTTGKPIKATIDTRIK